MLSRLQTVTSMAPLIAGTISLFSVVSARGFDRGFYPLGIARGFISLFMMLLIFALLGFALYYLIQKIMRPNSPLRPAASTPSAHSDGALDILRERLAKGEIEVEDYETRRRVLLSKE
jgi:uncharacterized membrane protein